MPSSTATRKRESRRAAGKCSHCDSPATSGVLCQRHRDIHTKSQRKRLEAKRKKLVVRPDDEFLVAVGVSERAYLAGIVDGEGCIHFTRSGRGSMSLCLRVAMATKSVITRIHSGFGGSVTAKKWKTEKYLVQHLWLVSGKRAYVVLTAILPYLIGKCEQAKLGIEFYERLRSATRTGYRGLQHTEETLKYMEKAYLKMSELKKDGGR